MNNKLPGKMFCEMLKTEEHLARVRVTILRQKYREKRRLKLVLDEQLAISLQNSYWNVGAETYSY